MRIVYAIRRHLSNQKVSSFFILHKNTNHSISLLENMLSYSSNAKYLHDGSTLNTLIKKNKYLTKKSKKENDTNQEKKIRITDSRIECTKAFIEELTKEEKSSKNRKKFLTEYEEKIHDFSFSKLKNAFKKFTFSQISCLNNSNKNYNHTFCCCCKKLSKILIVF